MEESHEGDHGLPPAEVEEGEDGDGVGEELQGGADPVRRGWSARILINFDEHFSFFLSIKRYCHLYKLKEYNSAEEFNIVMEILYFCMIHTNIPFILSSQPSLCIVFCILLYSRANTPRLAYLGKNSSLFLF